MLSLRKGKASGAGAICSPAHHSPASGPSPGSVIKQATGPQPGSDPRDNWGAVRTSPSGLIVDQSDTEALAVVVADLGNAADFDLIPESPDIATVVDVMEDDLPAGLTSDPYISKSQLDTIVRMVAVDEQEIEAPIANQLGDARPHGRIVRVVLDQFEPLTWQRELLIEGYLPGRFPLAGPPGKSMLTNWASAAAILVKRKRVSPLAVPISRTCCGLACLRIRSRARISRGF